MISFVAGYVGILIGHLTLCYFHKEFEFKTLYYGSCGYWLAVLVWAFS